MKNKFWSSFIGCILILLGVTWLGNVSGWWDFGLFTGWWSFILIVPALYWISQRGPNFGNVFLLMLGILCLGESYDLLGQHVSVWSLILPLFVILLGLDTLVKSFTRGRKLKNLHASNQEYPIYHVIFTSKTDVNKTQDLKGAELSALGSKLIVDFREANVTQNIQIQIDNVCSTVLVYVPGNVCVNIDGDNLFGGVTNHSTGTGAYSMSIRCSCVFGSIHIYD